MLIVQGALEFDRKDISVRANYIFVMDGSFVVGTEEEPFMQRAVITLVGTPISQEIPVYGAKSLSCRFCTLDLHGKPVLDGRTHTKLARTAAVGATSLHLTEPVDWDTGSEILVTSTAANGTMEEVDTRQIVSVADGGMRIILSSPTTYEHLGETRALPEGYTVDFRANVALLSRNVVVQGDRISALDRHGAHIMLHSRGRASIVDRSQGESLTARIENIEVTRSGQMGRIGRYSIHFHMIGATRNSYVRYNSIHHTYNRAIALHGVHYLRIQNNVAYETQGHTYFVEDGLETKNQITGNLAAVTRELFVGLSTDATPASYWLVNGDNYVANNIAAGSSHYGFWFFPESKVRGASEFEVGAQQVCPQGIPITFMDRNEAHNNGKYGLRIFTGLNHNGEGREGFYPRKVDSCRPVDELNTFVPSNFSNMFAWRNGHNGITFGSVAAMRIVDAVVADNVMRGIEGSRCVPSPRSPASMATSAIVCPCLTVVYCVASWGAAPTAPSFAGRGAPTRLWVRHSLVMCRAAALRAITHGSQSCHGAGTASIVLVAAAVAECGLACRPPLHGASRSRSALRQRTHTVLPLFTRQSTLPTCVWCHVAGLDIHQLRSRRHGRS